MTEPSEPSPTDDEADAVVRPPKPDTGDKPGDRQSGGQPVDAAEQDPSAEV